MDGTPDGRTDGRTEEKTFIGEAKDKYKIRSEFFGSDLNTRLILAIFLQSLFQK